MSISHSSVAGGFPIFVYYKILIFGAPRSTHVGDRHMHSQTFLYEIQLWTTFIPVFFYVMRVFGSIEHQSESNFLFL